MSQTEIQSVDPFWGDLKKIRNSKAMAGSGFELTERKSSFGKSRSTLNVSSKRANHTLSDVHGSSWLRRF